METENGFEILTLDTGFFQLFSGYLICFTRTVYTECHVGPIPTLWHNDKERAPLRGP